MSKLLVRRARRAGWYDVVVEYVGTPLVFNLTRDELRKVRDEMTALLADGEAHEDKTRR